MTVDDAVYRALLEAAGGALSPEQVASVQGGPSPQALEARRRAGDVIAIWRDGAWLYPACQFAPETGQIMPGVAADEGDFFAVWQKRALRHERFYFAFEVGGHTLEAANRHRFFFHATASASGFARTVAGAAQYAGEDVGLPIYHVRFGVAFGSDEPNVLRHRRVRRASVLTINDFVEIFRVLYVGRLHDLRWTVDSIRLTDSRSFFEKNNSKSGRVNICRRLLFQPRKIQRKNFGRLVLAE